MKIRNNKGITLIALVITIIVLLILAGVTISMVLGDDGIIAQAQSAKKAQKNADEKDAIAVAIGEARTSEYLGVLSAEEVKNKSKDEITPGNDYNNSVREIREFEASNGTKQYLPIPKGMAYAFGTIEEGAVVVDGEGNEFVWVPVADTTKMFTKSGENYTGKLYDFNNDGFTGNEPANVDDDNTTNISEYTDTLFQTEYNKMAKSVETYGGFYVGRYETSWTGSKVASVPNVIPMNGETPIEFVRDTDWNDIPDAYGANWYTFYNKQKELYANSSSVTSGMIYGSQWDAIMDWMSDVPNPDSTKEDKLYITDSTGMGHYCYNSDLISLLPGFEGGPVPIKTGSNPNYAVNNIYDLAGNYDEWTQEANGSDYRLIRGGCYFGSSSGSPASERVDAGCPTFAFDSESSRLQLYIK